MSARQVLVKMTIKMITKSKYLKRRIILTFIIAITIKVLLLPIIDTLINAILGVYYNSGGLSILFPASIIFYFIKDDTFIGKFFKKEDNSEIEVINKKQYLIRLIIALTIAVSISVILPFMAYIVHIGNFLISEILAVLSLASIILNFIDDNNVSAIHSDGEHNLEIEIKDEKTFLEHLLIAVLIAFCLSIFCAAISFSLIKGMYAELFNLFLTIGVFFGSIIFYFLYVFFRSIQKLPWLFGGIVVFVTVIAIANWI